MKYLESTFTVPAGPPRQMEGTCERCVWGTGEHANGCPWRARWVDTHDSLPTFIDPELWRKLK